MVSFKLRVILVSLFVTLLALQVTSRRRPRCVPRLCRKCDIYLHSRWRRSLPDAPRGHHSRRYDSSRSFTAMDRVLLEWVSMGQEDQKFSPAHGESSPLTDPELEEGVEFYEGKFTKRRSRSVMSHFRRCLYVLRTPCCRRINNSATYIGYRLRY